MIIATVGKNATGKDYLLGYISDKYGIPMISIGDIVRDIATQEGLEHNRDNLHYISEKYMSIDRFFFTKATIAKIESMRVKNILVSGVRPLEDVLYFRQVYGKDFLLIGVKITDDIDRFNRMLERKSKRDPSTIEEFIRADQEEERIFKTSESEKLADITVLNDGSIEEFNGVIDELYLSTIKSMVN